MNNEVNQIDSTLVESSPTTKIVENDWVRETRFGRWFLSTNTWYRWVLSKAVVDLKHLLGDQTTPVRQMLDAGCGSGLAFSLLGDHFKPQTIHGVDIDSEQLSLAREAAKVCAYDVQLQNCGIGEVNVPDGSIDLIFSHQLLHHVYEQDKTLQEYYRMLAPGGVILVSESCRVFIESYTVRYLFRHPKYSQKSAQEYVDLIRSNGFQVNDNQVKKYRPRWSHNDFGLSAKLGFSQKSKEPTEVLLVARKPG